ncbi:hypothetical protein CTEN210_18460 [Chaetoceros tenuissimus]|uniref:Leucine-rich repeat domain-containing protein n=1 Tax=Chaetoceros tenuissimus TaxID=426638 RepID=A0AAD3HG54_9STRA|nr:hypothetical protein CTEN210_18460 [Chaetoceros tenuissimus]
MRVQTEEWQRFIPGSRMYKGKKTLFYNGEKLYDQTTNEYLIYDKRERRSWKVIIVLPGVEVIPEITFAECENVKTIIMTDTVRRIEELALGSCISLEFVKLSTNLEYIGEGAFFRCSSLTSMFIPLSCREIGYRAFDCKKLIIFSVPQHTLIGRNVFAKTKLFQLSPFEEVHTNGSYINHDQVNAWVRDINANEEYALHRACCSFNPLLDIIYQLVRRNGLRAFRVQNAIGITPSQYLDANPLAQDIQKKVMNRYILEMMGETV